MRSTKGNFSFTFQLVLGDLDTIRSYASQEPGWLCRELRARDGGQKYCNKCNSKRSTRQWQRDSTRLPTAKSPALR